MRATVVTALLDLGRERIDRDWSYYLNSLRRFAAMNCPMVLYVSPVLMEQVGKMRTGRLTRVLPLDLADLEQLPGFDAMDAIRSSVAWRRQSPWIEHSPQARLRYYAPLIHHKPRLMAEAAEANPFSTRRFVWLDAGIFSNSMYWRFGRWVERDWLPEHGLLVFSYRGRRLPGDGEVNGMSARFFCEACGVPVRFWVRAGLLAGGVSDLRWLSDAFSALLLDTLSQRELGTEENLLTILAHRHPERFDRQKLWFHRWSARVAMRAAWRSS